MRPISIDQSHAVMQSLATNVDWSKVDGVATQNGIVVFPDKKEVGANFLQFLNNGGKCTIVVVASTITDYMKQFKIVSYINDLIGIVGDGMIFSEKSFSSKKLGSVKTELEIARQITGNKKLTTEEAEQALLKSGKLVTLADFIKHAYEAGSGWHLGFIEVTEKDGKKKVATVRAHWREGILRVSWFWFNPEGRWSADFHLLSAS